jgi:adapter protein MecA 1/2
MMTRAYEDFGFETENIPLMIEAVPISTDSIMIVVTKVEDPAQIDEKLDSIGERPTHRTFKEPEEDRLTDLKLMGRDTKERTKNTRKQAQVLMYEFKTFDEVTRAAHAIESIYIGDNSLYKYDNRYFLVLNKNQRAKVKPEAVVGIMEEFGKSYRATTLSEMFLKEHGKCLIQAHAIDVLAKYA